MVDFKRSMPRDADGRLDAVAWAQELCARHTRLDPDRLVSATAFLGSMARGESHLQRGSELAQLIADLHLDTASVVAGLVYRSVREGDVTADEVSAVLGADAGALVGAVARMANTRLLDLNNPRMLSSEARDQVENIKRMMIALVDDARVAVIKLAERVVALRAAAEEGSERQRRVAMEARYVFAPLANRLGIWRLKWELEDLAMRGLEPDTYMAIARQLDGRREERERRMGELAQTISRHLEKEGIHAEVHGRAKHIYSIWRKMNHKGVDLDEVYDVRAVRVVVGSVADCYSALGVIHRDFLHVPHEFDDYIANPKDNGYRSIHTAVRGPDGRMLEVQIRTREMHREAELGLCAHWSYKDSVLEDRSYSQKMDWLRQVVEWHEELGGTGDFGAEIRARIREERIFVYTPKGHVLDLNAGATPVDFAFRVHTEVGLRCKGAKVDGEPVALNTPLTTGSRVEIRTDPAAEPDRLWLEPAFGFITSTRARGKLQAHLRARGESRLQEEGLQLWLAVFERMGLATPDDAALKACAGSMGMKSSVMLERLALGDLTLERVLTWVCECRLERHAVECLELTADDRDGLLRDVSRLLADNDLSMVTVQAALDEEGTVVMQLEVRCQSLLDLAMAIYKLGFLDGVRFAGRVTGDSPA